jgi:hypothetical protein
MSLKKAKPYIMTSKEEINRRQVENMGSRNLGSHAPK